jgi:hypothetical protein
LRGKERCKPALGKKAKLAGSGHDSNSCGFGRGHYIRKWRGVCTRFSDPLIL